jgi:hypothetical protein
MSTVTRIMLEAEAASGREAMRAAMREEGLRAAMQAAARQADSRRGPPLNNQSDIWFARHALQRGSISAVLRTGSADRDPGHKHAAGMADEVLPAGLGALWH